MTMAFEVVTVIERGRFRSDWEGPFIEHDGQEETLHSLMPPEAVRTEGPNPAKRGRFEIIVRFTPEEQ